MNPMEECRQFNGCRRNFPLVSHSLKDKLKEVMPELIGLEGPGAQASIVSTDTHSQYRRQRIKEIVDVTGIPELSCLKSITPLSAFWRENRLETDTQPCCQRLRRMPFAVRLEVSKQLNRQGSFSRQKMTRQDSLPRIDDLMDQHIRPGFGQRMQFQKQHSSHRSGPSNSEL